MELQDYNKPKSIEGVQLVDLVEHYDDSGTFCEILRLVGHSGTENSRFFSPDIRDVQFEEIQINLSTIQPQVVKGFHLHKEQNDLWILPAGNRCIVNLIDARRLLDREEDLSDHSGWLRNLPSMRIVMGVKTQLLLIPKGVLHGICNPSLTTTITMLYAVDKFFNPSDEFRVKHNVIGDNIWEIQKG